MSSSQKAIFIFILGALLFSVGAWVRFNAEDLGSVKTPSGNIMVTHSKEYIDVALPVLWAGVTLVSLALAGWMFKENSAPSRRRSRRGYGSAEY